ncbi:uncharacterized protein [Rutidosis leptorrhynchoides]|uniref:uncharacterized protein n=1 Tax=Rutidosis leptorrhynchoides TaxID=125765 RepID=UPI003A99C1EE
MALRNTLRHRNQTCGVSCRHSRFVCTVASTSTSVVCGAVIDGAHASTSSAANDNGLLTSKGWINKHSCYQYRPYIQEIEQGSLKQSCTGAAYGKDQTVQDQLDALIYS